MALMCNSDLFLSPKRKRGRKAKVREQDKQRAATRARRHRINCDLAERQDVPPCYLPERGKITEERLRYTLLARERRKKADRC